jgi:hypothetical protein
MGLFAINWWVVLIGTVFAMVNGSIWYNPRTFFAVWWKIVGGGKETPGMGNMGAVWTLTVVAGAVKAIFIGVAVNAFSSVLGGISAGEGLLTGVIVAVGFLAPTYLVNKLFAGHGFKIWAIEVGNHFVDLLVIGLIFGLWH